GLYRQAVAEDGVMPDLPELRIREPQPRCASELNRLASHLHVDELIATLHERPELVDREVVLDAVAELLGHVPRVVGKGLRGLDRLPAAVFVLEGLRQIPVVQRRERLDARREQLVHEPAVEVEALRIRLAATFGEDPRPRNREPVRGRADGLHQSDVLLVPVVVIVGDVAVLVVLDLPGRVGVRIPDRRALAVLVPGAFDLVRGRGDAPVEPFREAAPHHSSSPMSTRSQSSPLERRMCFRRRPSSTKPTSRYRAIAASLCGNTLRASLWSLRVRAQSIAAMTRALPTPRPRQSRATNIPISPNPKPLSSTERTPTISPAPSATSVLSRCQWAARLSTSTGGSAAIPSRSSATAANRSAIGRRSASCAGRISTLSADTRAG